MKKTLFMAAAVVCAAFLLVSCTSTTENNSNAGNNNNAASGNNNNSTTRTTTTPAGDSTASTTGGDVGVAECDEYIKKYEACVSKVPEQARKQYNDSLTALRNSWKTLAANPQTKPSLAAACKQALDQAKTSMSSFGCTW